MSFLSRLTSKAIGTFTSCQRTAISTPRPRCLCTSISSKVFERAAASEHSRDQSSPEEKPGFQPAWNPCALSREHAVDSCSQAYHRLYHCSNRLKIKQGFGACCYLSELAAVHCVHSFVGNTCLLSSCCFLGNKMKGIPLCVQGLTFELKWGAIRLRWSLYFST